MEENLIAQFEEYHSITMPEWWGRGRKILYALLCGRDVTRSVLASAPQTILQTEPTFGLLSQLTERTYEHAAASIVCFSTKSAATAEVAARVAIESSVNIRFILSGDRNSLALSWLRAYVNHDAKQIEQWERLLDSLPPDERGEHQTRIATRRQVSQPRKNFLAQFEKEFASCASVNLQARWPTIADRFTSIGEAVAYRTTYARLSSQTHADAEDTINYILFTCLGDESLLMKMSEETVAFSEFLVAYGIYFYLLAIRNVCETFCLPVPQALESSTNVVIALMQENASAWGW
jgi:Family of unknown function (DUF5677)